MESKYSIHDLSRFQGEGPDNLSRFNMPLELGIAVGIRFLKDGQPATHNWVALVPPGFVHQKFVSDLGGFDPPDHDGTPAMVIRQVAAWLSMQPDFTPPAVKATTILDAYPEFTAQLDQARADALGTLTWPAIVKSAEAVVSQMADPKRAVTGGCVRERSRTIRAAPRPEWLLPLDARWRTLHAGTNATCSHLSGQGALSVLRRTDFDVLALHPHRKGAPASGPSQHGSHSGTTRSGDEEQSAQPVASSARRGRSRQHDEAVGAAR